jgi:peptidoglycan/LPS O-acetylase OafA/YrhL
VARLEWYPNVVPNVYWSLAIEEHFYMIWPVVVLLCGRARLVRVCLGVGIGALLLRVGLTAAGVDPIATMVLTPARIDSLALGGMIAALVRGPRGLAPLIPAARWGLPVSAVLLAVVYAVEGGLRPVGDLTRTVGFTLVATFFASLLVMVLGSSPGRPLHRAFTVPFMKTLGKYSYALYLVHGPIGSFLTDVVKPHAFPRIGGSELPGIIAYVTAATAASLFAAFVSWHLLEKHFLKLKRFFRDAPAPARAVPRSVPESAI